MAVMHNCRNTGRRLVPITDYNPDPDKMKTEFPAFLFLASCIRPHVLYHTFTYELFVFIINNNNYNGHKKAR